MTPFLYITQTCHPLSKYFFFYIHIDKLFNIVISVELHLLIQWQIDKKINMVLKMSIKLK